MPLLNVLGMCGNCPPVVIAVADCTEHMSEGGKKDCTFIAKLFSDEVEKWDPAEIYTDLFMFDGAGNVQKAGSILTAKYLRAMCIHGGEHVLSLFFSDIANLPAIKVCSNNFFVEVIILTFF